MFETARKLLRFRSLLGTLVARELKARYRGSLLGFVWSLVNPLLLLAVYAFVFGKVFSPPQAEGQTYPYALFLITGLFPWVWISTSLLEGTVSLVANGGLIRKAVFPAEILPQVSVLSNLVHFLFAVPILLGAMVVGRVMGYPVLGPATLLLPVVILLELVLAAGLALGLAALNVYFKDTRDLLANLLTLLFFLTPIIYELSAVPSRLLGSVVRWLNPFTSYTLAFQDVLLHARVPAAETWLQMILFALVGWWLGCAVFRHLSDGLVEAV